MNGDRSQRRDETMAFCRLVRWTMKGVNLQVVVRDNNVDQALRVLKKKMQREGILRELKERRAYEKPSEKRAREKGEAIRRARKDAKRGLSAKAFCQSRRRRLLPHGREPRSLLQRRPLLLPSGLNLTFDTRLT